ncbi:hypothetical protein F6B41_03615 [Microbacterium lushaniae]|nr:hypothetical protein F6B41_03615 [Microbacterium lushaniae]
MPVSAATSRAHKAIIGEPEVVEDGRAPGVEDSPAWRALKHAATALQALQAQDGSVPDAADHDAAASLVAEITGAIAELAPRFPHDAEYLGACVADFARWAEQGFGVPDFLDSLVAFQPQRHRIDGIRHLVVFPMYTQNGSRDRHVEALLVEVIWPEFIARLETEYANGLFVSLRLVDFTPGYDTNSAVLFPETVAMREIPAFTWGGIFQDREAARYRRVVRAAAEITKLELPADAARMLADQDVAEQAFVMWDILHDRTHMRGDLPFDPFMIKQRMPYFLYSLEELRCDLTAFRECVAIQHRLQDRAEPLDAAEQAMLDNAVRVQYAVIFDRIFRFAITGSRVRNYDGVGGQLLFAWLHQRGVLHWTDTALAFDWAEVPAAVVALGDAIDELYWRSIDRPKTAHWLAAYDLVRSVLTPHPASQWARGLPDEVLAGPPKGYTDAVLDDEFPLSMFYEALEKKMRPVIAATAGIRGSD